MSGLKDIASVTLVVNGEPAKQELSDIESRLAAAKQRLVDLQQSGADTKYIKKTQKEINKLEKDLERAESRSDGLKRALMGLEDFSPRELNRALRTLMGRLQGIQKGSKDWDAHVRAIQMIKEKIAEMNEELSESPTLWGRIKTFADDIWPVFDLIVRGYDSIMSTLMGFVNAYAEMDQEMANVRKFTGMTEAQVRSLNEEFKKIDTRTSREELNKLAQEAGRLGKTSIEDVLGFVRAADKINVALDDLGEGATLTLSKLTGIFGDEQRFGTEQSLLKVGSVINELSQNCSAAAPYLANFAERMGGVGAQAGLTIQQIMGFAAVLDSNSQKVEASSTALSQVIVRLYQEPAKYARVAGLDVEKFTKLLKTDTNAALILFLETLQKAGGMDSLSPMFKDMGENGSRAIAALSTLATHIAQVKSQQEAANLAFEEGTSIDKEFAVQNGTVQAALEKCKNHAHELQVELGERIQPLIRHFLVSSSSILRAILTLINYIDENKSSIIAIASATTAYIAVAKLHALWLERIAVKEILVAKASKAFTIAQKALSGVVAVARVGVVALVNAFDFLRHGLEVNIFMQQRWRAAMEKMKFTTWAGLILAVAAAFYMVYKRVTALTAAQKALREAENQANEEIAETVTKIRTLQGIIEDNNRTLWERHKAIVELRSIMDDYNGTLDKEGRLINHNTTLIDAYIKKLRERALASAMEDQLKQSFSRLVKQGLVVLDNSKSKDGQTDMFKSDLLSGNISADMFIQGKRVRGGDASFLSGAKAYAPSGKYNGMRTSAWALPIWGVESESYTAVQDFNKELSVFLTLSRQVDDNTRRSLVQQGDSGPKVNQQRYESDEAYKKAVDELKTTLTNAISAAGNDQKKKDAAEYQYQLGLFNLNTTQGGHAPDNDDNDDDDDDDDPPTPTPDRFAKEKQWRERAEAEARIDYFSPGEKSYSDYMQRMNQIAVDYNQMLLDREDVVGNERLKIQADYWEALHKRDEDAGKMAAKLDADTRKKRVDEENKSYNETLYNLNESLRKRLSAENLSAKERENAEKIHQEAAELAELNHLARLVNIYEEGSDERLQAQMAYQDAQLKAQKRHQQEYEKREAEYADIKAKVFGDNPEEKQQKYDTAFDALKEVYDREIAAAGDNAAEKLRIAEAFLQAQNELRVEYGLAAEEDTQNSMQRAVGKAVEWLNSPGGKAVTGTLSTLTSGMASIFSGLSTMMQAELELQTAAINKRYDAEIQAAQGNSYKVAKLEKKKEAEIAKVKNEANRKMFAMQVIQAVAQTAQNALAAFGSAAQVPIVGYVLAPIAAAMAVAAGAIQIAAIKKQQQASAAQGYSKGGFTRRGRVDEPAGIVHAGEWVASQKLLANPVARPLIEHLDHVQRTNTIGSLRSEDVSRAITAPQSISRIMDSDASAALMVAAIAQSSSVVERLAERLEKPIAAITTVAGDYGINQAKDEYDALLRNVTPKSKQK